MKRTLNSSTIYNTDVTFDLLEYFLSETKQGKLLLGAFSTFGENNTNAEDGRTTGFDI